MKLKLVSTFLLSLLILARGASAQNHTPHVTAYHTAGKALVAMALTKKVDVAQATRLVDTLLQEGVWFASEYSKVHPKGEKLMKIIITNVDEMKKLSYEDLEKQWHDLHYFEGKKDAIDLDLSDEDNEHFTNPIHIIVHPLLVLKAAQEFEKKGGDESLKQMKEEMEEGLEQLEKCAHAISKK